MHCILEQHVLGVLEKDTLVLIRRKEGPNLNPVTMDIVR
jgi:hypothetical protein